MKADLLGVYQKMRSELIEEMKKNQEEMLQKLESKIEDIDKDNKKSLEKLTSKLSKSNESPEKSDSSVKRFKLKHIFYNVNAFRKNVFYFSEWENHFNVKWRLMTARFGDHLGFYIFCEPIAPTDKWSIRTKNEYKVVGRNQEFVIRSSENCHRGNRGWGFPRFQEWGDMEEWFLVNGNLKVEVEITIIETVGLEKKRIRKFDESQKDVSDVILVVGNTKFYVSRTFLASQSDVFKTLLLGGFSESKQSEVTLNGIDPDDFHYFLEVLYGEFAIDDTTVEGVACLADMYDVPTAMRKCEEFLLNESKRTLKMKLELATRYHLKNLEEQCIREIRAIENVRFDVPKYDNHQTEWKVYHLNFNFDYSLGQRQYRKFNDRSS
ncbi:hypothetical protein B9Z55_007688 [Caenorhabditis nigoni]|nr:hypothetical protein B9Z55_007688 [Caenorhabditis nigoni]